VVEMHKRKQPLIQFISTVEGLETIEEVLPKPAKTFIPQWWKDIPSNMPNTVKGCPSFPDYFSQGFIMPMWMNSKLSYDKDKDFWSAESSDALDRWWIHRNEQALDYVKMNIQGADASFVFKASCPWMIITPPGYSVIQLPLFYHFNKDFSVLPGVIDTDIHHEVNQQVLYHGDGKDVIIKRGDPFALYVPFERKKYDYSISTQTEDQKKMFYSMWLNLATKQFSGVYREMQRRRDARLAK
jgi:hypothetical protein